MSPNYLLFISESFVNEGTLGLIEDLSEDLGNLKVVTIKDVVPDESQLQAEPSSIVRYSGDDIESLDTSESPDRAICSYINGSMDRYDPNESCALVSVSTNISCIESITVSSFPSKEEFDRAYAILAYGRQQMG